MISEISIKSDAPRARAVRTLKQWITEGSLPVGEPLPAERILADRLKVDRGTLRRALAVLQQDGYVESRTSRTRLACIPTDAAQSSLSNTVVVIARFNSANMQPDPQHRGSGWEIHTPHSVVEQLQRKNMFALVIHSDNADEDALRRITFNRPLGAIIADPNSPDSLQKARLLQKLDIPLVTYGGSPDLNEFDRVSSDHDAGAYQITRWMIERGRKRIQNAWCAPLSSYWYRGRWSGYERAMREAGLEPLPPIETPPFHADAPSLQEFESAARHLAGYLVEPLTRAEPIDALLVGTDRDVFGAAAACRFFGKQPNADIWLAGYDNYWNECSELRFESAGPLVTVDKRNVTIGYAMVDLLLRRVQGELPPEPYNEVVAPQLLETETSLNHFSSLPKTLPDTLTKTSSHQSTLVIR